MEERWGSLYLQAFMKIDQDPELRNSYQDCVAVVSKTSKTTEYKYLKDVTEAWGRIPDPAGWPW